MAAKKKWMAKAFGAHPGALHRETGTPMGKNIPAAKLEVHKGDTTRMKRQKNLAQTGKKYGGH